MHDPKWCTTKNPHLSISAAACIALRHRARRTAGSQSDPSRTLGPAPSPPSSRIPCIGVLLGSRKSALLAVHHIPISARKERSAQGQLPQYDHWYSGPLALEGHVRSRCRQRLQARRGTRREQLTLITEGRIPGELARLLMKIKEAKRAMVY